MNEEATLWLDPKGVFLNMLHVLFFLMLLYVNIFISYKFPQILKHSGTDTGYCYQ